MTIQEAIQLRHSVRSYWEKPLDPQTIAALQEEIDACNAESGLHIQLVCNEEKAFKSFLAHYGKFSGVQNYIVLVGPKTPDFDERSGWYGERLVLKAQMLGLNTCWAALTFSKAAAKKHCTIGEDERLGCVIALGYGVDQGRIRSSKSVDECCDAEEPMPLWFSAGMKAAMLAPTAINQQRFFFTLLPDGRVKAESKGGPCSKIDLGIVKYHFSIGAGEENVRWV